MGEEHPCGCAGDGCFEIPGEAAASAEPGKGSLDDPSARQEFKSFCGVGALDGLDGPFPDFVEVSVQLVRHSPSWRRHAAAAGSTCGGT